MILLVSLIMPLGENWKLIMIKQNASGIKQNKMHYWREAACARFLLRTKETLEPLYTVSMYLAATWKSYLKFPPLTIGSSTMEFRQLNNANGTCNCFRCLWSACRTGCLADYHSHRAGKNFPLKKENSNTSWSKIIVNSTSF